MKIADFKNEVRRYLKKNKMRQYHLSQKANLSPAILSKWLRDQQDISIKTLQKIYKAMK
jgi:transcriptional regulator with XRE-family HTH domain